MGEVPKPRPHDGGPPEVGNANVKIGPDFHNCYAENSLNGRKMRNTKILSISIIGSEIRRKRL